MDRVIAYLMSSIDQFAEHVDTYSPDLHDEMLETNRQAMRELCETLTPDEVDKIRDIKAKFDEIAK